MTLFSVNVAQSISRVDQLVSLDYCWWERCEEDEEDTILIHDMRVVFGDFELIETGEDDMEIYIYRG